MLKRWVCLFCLPFLFLNAEIPEEISEWVSMGTPFDWVKPVTYEVKEPAEGTYIHIQKLLEDVQENWEEKTTYFHEAGKILTQVAAHETTKLPIVFSPDYQKVVIHFIRIKRGDETFDCLEKSKLKLLSADNSEHEKIYDKQSTLVCFFNDLREGDIFEFAYSLIGVDPYHNSHIDKQMSFKASHGIDKLCFRLFCHPDHLLQVKGDKGFMETQVSDFSPTLREWVWEMIDVSKASEDSQVPDWYRKKEGFVQVSEYKNWQEVVQALLPIYSLRADWEEKISPEMLALTKKWTEATEDEHQRALLALRFVQDEIKYLSLYHDFDQRPTDPVQVFQQRFGDCKDKSLLLHALLKLMNISSAPALVDTKYERNLIEMLPTKKLNHAILQIKIGPSQFWVDPTLVFQGGNLQNTYCPDLRWALVIAPETQALAPIPPPVMESPTQIETSITLISPESAQLRIERTTHGFRAERIRSIIQGMGIRKFSEGFLEDVQKNYKGVAVTVPMSFMDDREKNVLKVIENYQISTRKRVGKQLLTASSLVLDKYIDHDIHQKRSSPYALDYPLWVTEHIHIENRFNDWAPDEEEMAFENPTIKFAYQMKKAGHVADFHYEFKYLQDHIPADLIQEYSDLVQEIEPNPSLELVITKTPS